MTVSDKPVIGFIGLGFMGHGMAANILKNGYTLQVKGNRNRAPVDDLVARGATEAASPKSMAEACDIIHLCLSNSPQVEAIVRGPEGLLAAQRAGVTVIDCTTADPGSTMALAAELAEVGMQMVDAPLGRTPKEAEAGTLDAMVGASPEVFERVRPVIDCWAGTVTRVGDIGDAHRMKLIMNFISLGYGALYSEALTLAAKSGISPQIVRDVIAPSRMGNGFFDTFMRYVIDRDRDAHKFSIANASKDVRYAMAMATDAGVVSPMGAAIRNYFTHAEAIGKGDDYVPMLSDHVARLSGIEMATEVELGAGEDS